MISRISRKDNCRSLSISAAVCPCKAGAGGFSKIRTPTKILHHASALLITIPLPIDRSRPEISENGLPSISYWFPDPFIKVFVPNLQKHVFRAPPSFVAYCVHYYYDNNIYFSGKLFFGSYVFII